MASVEYDYTKLADTARLSNEIIASPITRALDYINQSEPSDLSIYFKTDLTAGDSQVLDALVATHINTPLYDSQIVAITPKQEVNVAEVHRSEKFLRKYDSVSGDVTKSCLSTSWTEFYDIDFSPNELQFSELVYKCSNLDIVKVEVDGESVITTTLNDLKKVIVDDDGITMKDIDVSYTNNISTLQLDLNYHKGSQIKIYQKRRTGNGDLTAKGYVLSYIERK